MSKSKKRIFTFISLLVPILFFVALELVLRWSNYGEEYPLFIDDTSDPNYQVLNPEVSKRYFPVEEFATKGQYDPFLKSKAVGALRVFVQGASTSAGFPYQHGGSFPRLLEQKLTHAFPGKVVEIINTSLAATNSFTVLDFVDEYSTGFYHVRVDPTGYSYIYFENVIDKENTVNLCHKIRPEVIKESKYH